LGDDYYHTADGGCYLCTVLVGETHIVVFHMFEFNGFITKILLQMSKVILLSVSFQLLFSFPLSAQEKVDLDYDKTFRQIFYTLYEVAEKSYHDTRPDSCDSFYNKLTLGWSKSKVDYTLE
jgi:hypothetical protein